MAYVDGTMHKKALYICVLGPYLLCVVLSDQILNISEDASPNTAVGTIKPSSGGPPYKLIESDFHGQLKFDTTTGIVTTVTHLDRETKAEYPFIVVSDTGFLLSVKVIVKDKNDNPPKFSRQSYKKQLPEDSPVTQQISLGSVSDADTGENSLKKVEITKGNVDRKFKLQEVKSSGTLVFLRLVLLTPLDYETTQRYDLEVTAYDGGNPKLSAVLPITIEVTNLNDEVPTFDTTRYLAVVNEDRAVGSTILNVSASDKDLGPAGKISYYINHSRSDLEHYFSVDKNNGAVKLEKSLDFERQKNHTVIVSVRDHGVPAHTAHVHVQINVRDLNDHAPQMRLEFLSDGVVLNSTRVSEAVNVDDFVARLSVRDSDSSHVTVKLIAGSEWFSLISPTRDNYMLTLRRRLDRELQSYVNVSLLATDNGKPPLTSRLDVRVTVEDSNDRAPVFEQSFYSARIAVDSPVNTTVVRVNASDEDSGENGRVSYRLVEGGDHPWFKIDSSSGVISTDASLSCRLVTLVVQARDHGSPRQLTDNATIQISITGANMHTPVFSKSYYSVHVKENTSPGVCFYKFHASDADCGAGVAYHLVSDTSVALFRLEQYKGRLCVQSAIDHERRPALYQLILKATDKDSRLSYAAVDVSVEDINDNNPTFVESQIRVTVAPRPVAGEPVAAAVAFDVDSGANSRLTYAVIGDSGRWIVNASSGLVTLLSSSTEALPTVSLLTVKVTDHGGLVSKTNLGLQITASDTLRFQRPLYQWSVEEGVAMDLGIISVVGHDTRSAVAITKYSGDRDERISLDANGRMRATSSTRAVLGPLVLVVRATQGVNVAYSQVVVTVRPSSRPTPRFERTLVQLDVLETAPTPSVLYRFFAGLDDGRLRYTFVSGASPYFDLNATGGHLWLRSSLDFESSSNHRLKVRAATISGNPSAEMTLNLRVLDANDHTPECNPMVINITIPDSSTPGYLLTKVNCTDRDKGTPNGLISYTLLASSEYNLARIDSTGRLTLAGGLSRLQKLNFVLTVRAQDGGSPPRFSDVIVKVTVKDTNNMAPQFSQSIYTFWVTENSVTNTPVGITGATDGDRGANARIRYRITGTTAFTVNQESGALYTASVLDREQTEQHEFILLAEDQGVPALTGTASVTVTVLDVNDQVPEFAGPNPYLSTLMEGLPAGADVLVVSASDKDLGANGTVSYALEPANLPFRVHAVSGLIVTTASLDYETTPQYRLMVVARDGGQPAKETRRPLLVSVLDASEGTRLLASSKLAFFVPENAPAGTLVGLVRPRVANFTGRDLVYRLVAQGPDDAFFLDYRLGRLTTTRPLDRERNANYSLTVQAVDQLAVAPPRSAVAQVTVKVLDLNDNGPRFVDIGGRAIGNPLYISVREEGVPGGILFRFAAPDPDAGLNGTVAYSFRGDSRVLDYFNLGSVNGVLRVVKPIDRERVDQLAFEVIAQDQCAHRTSRRSSALTVIVRVVDINDHRPTFVSPRGATVLLDDPVNTTVMHVVARDPDKGPNGLVVYRLAHPTSSYFALGATSGLLTLRGDLRLTDVRSFALNITATDSALDVRQRRSAWAVFTVAVLAGASGRGRPVFTKGGVYKALHAGTVMSGLAARQPLLTVLARAPGGRPSYALVPGLWDNLFHVDNVTGLVAVREGANLTSESYSLPVTATDPKSKLMAIAVVELQARPANLHTPAFEKSFYSVSILEERPYTSFMVLVAHDADPSDRSRLRYAIQSGNKDHKFILDPISGRLSCVPLSRASAKLYNLVITVSDSGRPISRTGTTTVQVIVVDANNHAPVFTASRYSARVAEDRPVGTFVLNVTATDADEGANGRVWYQFDTRSTATSVTEPDFVYFAINANTGEIRTAFPLDRERRTTYTLTVVASDSSRERPFSSVVTVDVTVSDANDNTPQWTRQPFSVAITRNEVANSLLASVRATDADHLSNLTYRLLHDSAEFRMDATTGSVYTRRAINVVTGAAPRVVSLPIEVSDGVHRARGYLEVTVGGPTFHQLQFTTGASGYLFRVDENSVSGTLVGVVGLFNTSVPVEFDIVAGNDDGALRLNKTSGQLTVAISSLLDFETRPQRQLWVRARSGTKVGYTKIIVNLNDVDDHPPRFAQSEYVAHVWEKAPAGEFVARPVAIDLDTGPRARRTYAFTVDESATSLFRLDPNTGRITVQHGADYFRKSDYRLQVQAAALNDPRLVGTCTVLVRILNRNNQQPTVPALTPVTVDENTNLGKEIAVVRANDPDQYPPLTYHLFDQPDLPFAVGLFSGKITLISPLDYEKEDKRQFNLRITVSDSVHLVNTTLRVTVKDVNDNTPKFSGSKEVGVPLGTSADFVVAKLLASDADPGPAPTFSRCGTLPLRAASTFLVQSGSIVTATAVGSSAPPAAVLCVEARDSGGLRSRRAFLLEVTEANRHAPRFAGGAAQRRSVPENTAVGETVHTFKCSDADTSGSSGSGTMRYSLTTGVSAGARRHFSVVPQTGQLVLVAALDREKIESLQLSVQCSDSGRPPLTATARLEIRVEDVNDNAPKFLDANYSAQVTAAQLSAGLPRKLVRLAAVDNDSGANGRIRFRLLSGPRFTAFSVNGTSGWVSLTAPVTPGRYSLVVEAVDCDAGRLCQPARRDFVTVNVTVSHVLPKGLTFPASVLTVSVRENVPLESLVFRPRAHGAPPITFSILNGADAVDFRLKNGAVLTRKPIDYETKKSYRFTLRARDAKNSVKDVPVHVLVIDEDEFPPKFDTEERFVSVSKGVPRRGDVLARVKADDADGGAASLTAYLLVNASMDLFGVRPITGEIYMKVDLLPKSAPSPTSSSLSRKRRDVSINNPTSPNPNATETPSQRKNFTIVVKAWSGSLSSMQRVNLEMDFPLGAGPPPSTSPPVGLTGTLLVLVVVVAVIITTFIVGVTFFYVRRRCRPFAPEKGIAVRRNGSLPPSPPVYESTFDPMGRPPLPPRCYEPGSLRRTTHNNNRLNCGLSLGGLGPASSGRGSDAAADEELRMITRGGHDRLHSPVASSVSSGSKFLNVSANLPDSGVQMAYSDIDASSQQSMLPPPAINHVDYLARLGIGGSGGGTSSLSDSCSGGTVFFTGSVPGHGHSQGTIGMRPEEITLRELERHEEPLMKSPPTVSHMVSSLSPQHAPFDDAQFRLDHLLNWTPSYQPLAQVFSEIARLKDDPGPPPPPHYLTNPMRAMPPPAPQHLGHDPPPLLTDLPPQVLQPILQPSLAPLTEHEVQI